MRLVIQDSKHWLRWYRGRYDQYNFKSTTVHIFQFGAYTCVGNNKIHFYPCNYFLMCRSTCKMEDEEEPNAAKLLEFYFKETAV